VLAQEILDRIQPGRFFAQDHLMIGGDQSTTAFRSSSVVRIDFVTDHVPHWPYDVGVGSIQELSEGEYRERYRQDLYDARNSPNPISECQEVVYAEMEMVNGERAFFEVHADRTDEATPAPLDQAQFIQQLFTSGGMHGRRRSSGVILLNPSSIVRVSFYPGAAETQADAWPAHRLRD
jgi:hypothetical protein